MSAELKTQFDQAAEAVKGLATRPSNDDLLTLYGLYKQATVGDNETAQPWAVQLEARSKWDAWTKNKGTSKEDAMAAYVKFANALISKQ